MRTMLKWKCFKQQKVPKLSSAYKVRRVNFAKKFKDINWSRVMFTDESPFKLYYVPNNKNDVVWGSQETSVTGEVQPVSSGVGRYYSSRINKTSYHPK